MKARNTERNKQSILIVEDETVVALDIEESLRSLGFLVSGIVASGEAALEHIESAKPDAVLMDIRLQGALDGIETASRIKEIAALPVIFLTAHADDKTLERAKITEPYGYILKPYEELELGIALDFALYKFSQTLHMNAAAERVVSEPTFGLTDRAVSVMGLSPDLLNGIDFFSSVSKADLKRFLACCFLRELKSGELLTYEGERPECGFLVLHGRLGLLKTSISGRELIVELLLPRDVYGLFLAIENLAPNLAVRAQVQSQVLCAPAASILQLIDSTPALYRSLVAVVTERLRRSHDIARALAHDKVEVRIANALHALIADDVLSGRDGMIGEIRITRQELANLTGSTVETAIRTTKAMERNGILALPDAGKIQVLDAERLKSLCSAE